MKFNINPFNSNNPMTLRQAFVVSAISATSTYVIVFLASCSIGDVRLDPLAFIFDSAKIWLASFFGTFMSLSGIEAVVKKMEKNKESNKG